jgi:predicted TIM-barrel fold metal-dependent hydrolase
MKDSYRCPSSLSRRSFVSGLASVGGTLLLQSSAAAQNGQSRPASAGPRRIDVHCHLVAPEYKAYFTKYRSQMSKYTQLPPEWSPEKHLADMEAGGVATSVVSLPMPGIYWGGRDRIRTIARQSNEYNAKLMSDHPGRFGMFATLPGPNDIDGCLKEAQYALDTLKADGIHLKTNYFDVGQGTYSNDRWLGDPSFTPLYRELDRRRTVIYTHPQDAACCINVAPPIGRTTIEYNTNTTRTIVHLVETGTAARYPNIRWIFSHAGGTMPFLAGRILGEEASYLRDGGVLAPGSPKPRTNEKTPKGTLYELQRFFYDTAATSNPASMLALRRVVPLSQIVFGTDFPYGPSARIVKELEASAVFNAQEMQAVNRGNAAKILPKYGS